MLTPVLYGSNRFLAHTKLNPESEKGFNYHILQYCELCMQYLVGYDNNEIF
jgi:hypothetical protein